MWYLVAFMVGGFLGVLTSAIFGAGKIRDLEEENERLWHEAQKYRARLLLRLMEDEGETKPKKGK